MTTMLRLQRQAGGEADAGGTLTQQLSRAFYLGGRPTNESICPRRHKQRRPGNGKAETR